MFCHLALPLALALASSRVAACPEHGFPGPGQLNKRAGGELDWAYDASYNWGMLNEKYRLCQTGTRQSPIQLFYSHGLSHAHLPSFDEASYAAVPGVMQNWGYGPAFNVNGSAPNAPRLTYDNQTLYLKGLHVHAPADHTVQGIRSKAELHLVHGDASGANKGVLAIRIDPGNAESPFFAQLLRGGRRGPGTAADAVSVPHFDSQATVPMTLDVVDALREVSLFRDAWTYEGSLTSPPCTEGLRFWVARNIMYVSVAQMQAILAVSTYSAREEQQVWEHNIGL